jgi:4'-phosphopantetheinyl transferase
MSFPFPECWDLPDSLIVYGKNLPFKTGKPDFYLSEDEQNKYNRLKKSGQSELQKSCRAVLKILLAEYTHVNPENIRLKVNRFGKPYLENADLWFNVSHTDKTFIIAISKKGRIGIDMEEMSEKWEDMDLSDYVFSDEEKQLVNNQEDFFKMWTMKEALLKAYGTGLTNQLKKINTPEIINKYRLFTHTFNCPGNEIASVVSNRNFELTYFQLTDGNML